MVMRLFAPDEPLPIHLPVWIALIIPRKQALKPNLTTPISRGKSASKQPANYYI